MTDQEKIYKIQRYINGKGSRVTRKQSQIGWYLLDARHFCKRYPVETPTVDQALKAAMAVAGHKGRFDDGLKPLIDIVAAFLVSVGR